VLHHIGARHGQRERARRHERRPCAGARERSHLCVCRRAAPSCSDSECGPRWRRCSPRSGGSVDLHHRAAAVSVARRRAVHSTLCQHHCVEPALVQLFHHAQLHRHAHAVARPQDCERHMGWIWRRSRASHPLLRVPRRHHVRLTRCGLGGWRDGAHGPWSGLRHARPSSDGHARRRWRRLPRRRRRVPPGEPRDGGMRTHVCTDRRERHRLARHRRRSPVCAPLGALRGDHLSAERAGARWCPPRTMD
jgi:hypothetical protein